MIWIVSQVHSYDTTVNSKSLTVVYLVLCRLICYGGIADQFRGPQELEEEYDK